MLIDLKDVARRHAPQAFFGVKSLAAGPGYMNSLSRWSLESRDDLHTRALLRSVLRRSDNCIDVGAAKGTVLSQILQYAPDGRHVAIEAIPALSDRLQKYFSHRGVTVVAACATDSPGIASFYIAPEDTAYSGMQLTAAAACRGATATNQVSLPAIRVDDVAKGRSYRVLKIDVEGAEHLVLRGAAKVLECRPFIVFEHGEHRLAYGDFTREIFDTLSAHDLAVSTLELYLRRRPPFTLEMFSDFVGSGYAEYFVAAPRESWSE
jgi:FkbM family methyltransferase